MSALLLHILMSSYSSLSLLCPALETQGVICGRRLMACSPVPSSENKTFANSHKVLSFPLVSRLQDSDVYWGGYWHAPFPLLVINVFSVHIPALYFIISVTHQSHLQTKQQCNYLLSPCPAEIHWFQTSHLLESWERTRKGRLLRTLR